MQKTWLFQVKLSVACVTAFFFLGCGGDTVQTTSTSNGKTITVEYPKTLIVQSGSTAELRLRVSRQGFEGPVDVKITNLPEGVQIVEQNRSVPDTSRDVVFTLKAADNTKPVADHPFVLAAQGAGVAAGPFDIKLSVKTTQEDMKVIHEKFEKVMNEQLTELDGQLKTLQDKATVLKDDAKVQLNSQLVNLQKQRDTMRVQMLNFRSNSKEAWKEFSGGLERAYSELSSSTKAALAKYK